MEYNSFPGATKDNFIAVLTGGFNGACLDAKAVFACFLWRDGQVG
jgi:hypothetical protein